MTERNVPVQSLIDHIKNLIYWDTREVVEPIKTWWMKFM